MFVYLVQTPDSYNQSDGIAIFQTIEQCEKWVVEDALSCNLAVHKDEAECYLDEKTITVVYNEADNEIVLRGQYFSEEDVEYVTHEIHYSCRQFSMPKPLQFEDPSRKWKSLSEYALHQ